MLPIDLSDVAKYYRLTGFSFMHPPLLRRPPDWDLPDPMVDAQWYGEIWLKYPLSYSLCPLYFGHSFRARCEFRIIMNEFCHTAYSKVSEVTLDEANAFYRRLRSWYNNLAEPLLPQTIVFPGQLQLQ